MLKNAWKVCNFVSVSIYSELDLEIVYRINEYITRIKTGIVIDFFGSRKLSIVFDKRAHACNGKYMPFMALTMPK